VSGPRWQYRIVNVGSFRNAGRMVNAFATLGAEGWELAAMYDKNSNWIAGMEKGFALFKREVPADAEPIGPWAQADYAGDFDGDTSGGDNVISREWLATRLAEGRGEDDIAQQAGTSVAAVRQALKRFGF